MNEKTIRERSKRLLEINELVRKLDATIRPAAFSLLEDYILDGASPSENEKLPRAPKTSIDQGRGEFFSAHNHDKPSDNVLLLGAYHFSQYGSSPFTLEEMKALANEVGVTIPERLDKTFLQAKRNGKNLFLRAGKKAFRPTVHGEAFFKTTYKLSKGTHQKSQEAQK